MHAADQLPEPIWVMMQIQQPPSRDSWPEHCTAWLAFPREWLEKLAWADRIAALADRLVLGAAGTSASNSR